MIIKGRWKYQETGETKKFLFKWLCVPNIHFEWYSEANDWKLYLLFTQEHVRFLTVNFSFLFNSFMTGLQINGLVSIL